jgi:hypothetical protein
MSWKTTRNPVSSRNRVSEHPTDWVKTDSLNAIIPPMFIVISYDIPEDKRRTRIHKILKSYGQWMQYSVV